MPAGLPQLCCHELLNGPLPQRTLDEPSCLLVVCWLCNAELCDKSVWPLARQLAVLKKTAPERYNLRRLLEIRNPRAMLAVTEEEVYFYLDTIGDYDGTPS